MASFAQTIMWREMWMKRERVKETENNWARKEDQGSKQDDRGEEKKSNDKAVMGVGKWEKSERREKKVSRLPLLDD